jgi:NADP-dependent 3-hydroxy acid dehydrogenase YdfG
MDLVEGSSVVITGAASGIGEGLARECVNRGLRVALADVEEAPLDKLVDQLSESGGTVMAGVVDVSDSAAFAESVEAEFRFVDVVVANAGVIGPRRPLWEQNAQDWEWIIGVNLLGVSNTWMPFLPGMVK